MDCGLLSVQGAAVFLRDKCPCIGASGRSAPENLSYSLLQRKRADEEEEEGGCRTEQGTVMQIHSLCN